MLLVGNKGEDTVSFVDFRTGNECARVPTGKAPHEIALSPDGRRAVTSNLLSGTVNLFDVANRQPLRGIRVSGSPAAMQVTLAFADEGRSVLVAETAHNTVAQVDLDIPILKTSKLCVSGPGTP